MSATIAEQNAAIDSMIGEVSVLRQRQAAIEAELAEKQAELERASAELEADTKRLAIVRAQSAAGALGASRSGWSRSMRPAQPDVVNVDPRIGELV